MIQFAKVFPDESIVSASRTLLERAPALIIFTDSITRHHGCKRPATEKQAIRIAGNFGKVPTLKESFCLIVDAVQYDRHKGKGLSGFETVAQ